MVRSLQFIIGILILVAIEVLSIYYLAPFPGSQRSESLEIAYFLHQNGFYLRTVGLLVILFPIIHYYWLGSKLSRWLVTISLAAYLYIFLMVNYKFQADKIFYQPKTITFAKAAENIIKPEQQVLGLALHGVAKAYPLEIIGYHHQIRDTFSKEPVMITYCTVCRTGRVFHPEVNGKPEEFRLVGMDHFNAMFEDATTGSWWRQVNGEAVVGSLKGQNLQEINSQQLSLRAWLEQYPDSWILQPDSNYRDEYNELAAFDEGTIKSNLLKRDSLSWKENSWVVGVQLGTQVRAYDWNELLDKRVINDILASTPILVAVEKDSASFHVWKRDSMDFSLDAEGNYLVDIQTKSVWNWTGKCISGPFTGKQLTSIQSYQEFWHSWKTFRSQSTQYPAGN